MSWLKANHRFPDHRAILVLSRRDDHCLSGDRFSALQAACNQPELLEPLLREIVMSFRPELKGCVIHWMDFDYSRYAWKIGVSHERLPPVDCGDCSPEIPIDRRLQTLQIQLASADAALQRPLENEVWKETDAAKLTPYRPVGERLAERLDEQSPTPGNSRIAALSDLYQRQKMGERVTLGQLKTAIGFTDSPPAAAEGVPLKDEVGNVIGTADVAGDGTATLHVQESSREWFQRIMSQQD